MSADKSMPWFRMYSEAMDDEKLRLLAFEDRWHFVALLCCKGSGILDAGDTPELMRRKVAVKLGLDARTFDEAMRRIAEVGLIDRETLQPLAWDKRQHRSDTSAERTRKYRENKKKKDSDGSATASDGHSDVTVTSPTRHSDALDTDTEKDTDKNPPTPLAGGESPASLPKRPRKVRMTLRSFIDDCLSRGEKPISEHGPLLDYVRDTGLPMEFAGLAWEVFKCEFLPGGVNAGRLQADWRRHFMNYVTRGYYRLWYAEGNGGDKPVYKLTTQGLQAQAAVDSRRKEAA